MIRLFRVFVPVGTVALLVAETVLLATSFIVAAYLVLEGDPTIFLLYDGGLTRIAIVVAGILVGLYFQDLYSQYYVKSRITLAQQLCMAIGIAFLLQGFISYLNRYLRMPLHLMAVGSVIALATLFFWRLTFSKYAGQVMGRTSLLLVGGSELLEDIGSHIEEHPELGIEVAGYVDDRHTKDELLPGGKALGCLEDLQQVVEGCDPSRIVVGMFERRNRLPVAALLELRFAGHIIEEVATAYERVCLRVSTKELRPSHLIYSGELGPRRQTVLVQAIYNYLVAIAGIVLSAPLMALTALAVRFTSPGPMLYRQVRVGMDNKPFTVLKFRSMRVDAEAATGAVWATKDDPRVTPVGRLIRRIRFDELPQLFNVLRGEMAIVGPRPERPEFVKALSEHIPYYRQRHSVLPGITGWAQINYKYGDTMEDTITKLEYDLYYIKNMSFSLDTYIIFHTIKAMLLSRGAQ